MSASWARGDKCPLWNAEMNSQKGRGWVGGGRLSSSLQKSQTREFSHLKFRMGVEEGCWGNSEEGRLLATQTLDCETSVQGPTEQRPLFPLSSPGPKATAA